MITPVTLGVTIRDARIAKGLSQEQLGNLAGKSKGFMSDIEADRYSPGHPTLIRLASALDLNPEYLRRLKYKRDRERRIEA